MNNLVTSPLKPKPGLKGHPRFSEKELLMSLTRNVTRW